MTASIFIQGHTVRPCPFRYGFLPIHNTQYAVPHGFDKIHYQGVPHREIPLPIRQTLGPTLREPIHCLTFRRGQLTEPTRPGILYQMAATVQRTLGSQHRPSRPIDRIGEWNGPLRIPILETGLPIGPLDALGALHVTPFLQNIPILVIAVVDLLIQDVTQGLTHPRI